MNQEQFMSLLRTVLQIAGTLLVSKNIFSSADWTLLAGGLLMAGPALWGILDKTKANLVAKVNAMPEVKGVVTTNTLEGKELAQAVDATDATVAPAGTMAAAAVAR